MHFKRTALLILVHVLYSPGMFAEDLSGSEIMDAVSRNHNAPVEMETLSMTLTDKKDKTTDRDLRQYSRRGDDGFYKYLLVFDEPKGIMGVALLTWEKTGGDDDQWLYLPAMGKQLKRIASGGRMNYFMGTDFAFEDLVAEKQENFRYERQADQKLDNIDVFVIDAHPLENLVTGYQKRELMVRQDNFAIVRIDYFQRRTGKLMKRLTLSELEHIDADRWRSSDRLMENFVKKHKTRITTKARSFESAGVPETIFAQRHILSRNHMR